MGLGHGLLNKVKYIYIFLIARIFGASNIQNKSKIDGAGSVPKNM